MGEVVAAALLSHVPTIMLPKDVRYELNDGKEITIVTGLERLRKEKFETLDYDTVIVLDSHWFTTVEFVVTSHARRAGLFTAEELPRGMCRIPYEWRGDPELAEAIAARGEPNGTWITAIDDEYLPLYYPSINLWSYLGKGLDKQWISVSVCQTGETDDFLRVGRARSTSSRSCASTSRAIRRTSSARRRATWIRSASPGSPRAVTTSCSRRCRNSSPCAPRRCSPTTS